MQPDLVSPDFLLKLCTVEQLVRRSDSWEGMPAYQVSCEEYFLIVLSFREVHSLEFKRIDVRGLLHRG